MRVFGVICLKQTRFSKTVTLCFVLFFVGVTQPFEMFIFLSELGPWEGMEFGANYMPS